MFTFFYVWRWMYCKGSWWGFGSLKCFVEVEHCVVYLQALAAQQRPKLLVGTELWVHIHKVDIVHHVNVIWLTVNADWASYSHKPNIVPYMVTLLERLFLVGWESTTHTHSIFHYAALKRGDQVGGGSWGQTYRVNLRANPAWNRGTAQ